MCLTNASAARPILVVPHDTARGSRLTALLSRRTRRLASASREPRAASAASGAESKANTARSSASYERGATEQRSSKRRSSSSRAAEPRHRGPASVPAPSGSCAMTEGGGWGRLRVCAHLTRPRTHASLASGLCVPPTLHREQWPGRIHKTWNKKRKKYQGKDQRPKTKNHCTQYKAPSVRACVRACVFGTRVNLSVYVPTGSAGSSNLRSHLGRRSGVASGSSVSGRMRGAEPRSSSRARPGREEGQSRRRREANKGRAGRDCIGLAVP